MDPLTQGALGAAAGQSAAPRERMVAAGGLAWISGMAPDLDVLIRSTDDPLLFLEYHRQFTHALVFIPIGAAICAAVLYPIVRRKLRYREAWLWCLIGYATHGVLDACTSYGTQLLWPFSNARIAWNNVSVIDPVLTVPLLLGVVTTFFSRRSWPARAGFVWALAYLGLGWVQADRAVAAGQAIAASRGHTPAEVTAKPSFANLLVWKTLYAHDGTYYVDAVRMGREARWTPGAQAPALEVDRDLPWLDPESLQARDLERFRWFSQGYIALDPHRENTIIDIRYSMLPGEIDGLWGITLNPAIQDTAHVRFETWRDGARERSTVLIDMIKDQGFGQAVSLK